MSKAIRVLIVDDEPGARRRLERLLRKEAGINVVAQAGSGREALEQIDAHLPNLIFLDIQMPVMSGIDVVRQIRPERMPVVVFVTAYDEYAVRAFELAALDYLMKPFDDERFEQTLDRAKEAILKKSDKEFTRRIDTLLEGFEKVATHSKTSYIERIGVDIKGQLRIVPVRTIDYITASGNYVYLHVGKEKLLVREKMQQLDQKLSPELFYRIHRSSIVRLDTIERLIVNPGGDYAARLQDGILLKVSRNRWRELSLRLGIQTPSGEKTV